MEAPRAFANGTSISAGIDFGVTQLDRAPYKAHRRVIDVSGDGDNNSGREPTAARDVAIAKGITINGLVILTELPSHSYSSHTNPPGGLQTTIATTSSAAPMRSSRSRRTSIPSATPSPRS